MRDRILVVGAGTFQLPLVEYASNYYDVILAAPVIDNKFKKHIKDSILVDVRDKNRILDFAKKNNIIGVVTDQTDIAVRTVAFVADSLGLPGIGYETGCLFTNKSLMRKKLIELGIDVLPCKTVNSLKEALEFYHEYRCSVILKPIDTQGSRGVSKCDTEEEIIEKYDYASKWSSDSSVIIEKYATGREFVVEGMAYNYEFKNLCIGDTDFFNLPDTFAAKTRIFPSTADEALTKRVYDLNMKIITGFGLKQGITHSEFIMDGDNIYLIETAARGGGVYISSDLIHYSTGLNTEKFLIDIATNCLSVMPSVGNNIESCGYMAFYIPNGVIVSIKGIDEVNALEYVHRSQLDEIYIGKEITGGQTDKTSRYAITVSGKSRSEVIQHMENIRHILNIECRSSSGIRGLIWE